MLPAAPQSTDREMLEWTRTGVVARQVVDDAARKLGVLAATNRQPELDLAQAAIDRCSLFVHTEASRAIRGNDVRRHF